MSRTSEQRPSACISCSINRRSFLSSCATCAVASVAGLGLASARSLFAYEPQTELAVDKDKALIAMTLDLEMSRHYPKWEMTEWDYDKGNLNEPTKQYTLEACRRVKAKGGVIHSFMLGQTLEQENVDWLKEIIDQGHPVGNHTYDHVNVWSKSPLCQQRFQRAPWLVEGKTAAEVISDSIHMCSNAMRTRLGIEPVGFRTPGGSRLALIGRPDVQEILLESGFTWVSSMSKFVPFKDENPTEEDFQRIVDAQKHSQPFIYPSGLLEVPFSPISDVAAFRRKKRKWKLSDYLKMVERNVRWAIEHRAMFDLLGHPSIMYVEDPEFRTYELICDLVDQAGDKAAIVGLDVIAERARLSQS